jgi:hypothetical protein
MLHAHLAGLVKYNKLIKMHGVSNFKICATVTVGRDQLFDILGAHDTELLGEWFLLF